VLNLNFFVSQNQTVCYQDFDISSYHFIVEKGNNSHFDMISMINLNLEFKLIIFGFILDIMFNTVKFEILLKI
jgi:hypothetical protein